MHKHHFSSTLEAVKNIKSSFMHQVADSGNRVQLPPSRPGQKKLLVLDMDETLIHCVDDPQTEETDVILEIDFGDEGMILAGINVRPFVNECLHQASKDYMIIVFTASN